MADKATLALSNAARDATRILITDDSLVIRKAMQKMLRADFPVVLADSGEAGWQALIDDPDIKVLITDIEMPGLDGYGLICRVRAAQDERLRDLPIIAITGAEDEETKARALACGATDFIVKPIDPLQLQARIQAQVKFSQTSNKLRETEEALEDQATLDPLTRLSSRRYFLQRGEQDFAYAQRRGDDLALVRLEIDQLKSIYRQFGDDVVDEVLVWLGKVLTGVVRTEDTVARVGGAEFAILVPGTDVAKAEILCQRILSAVRAKPFLHGQKSLPVTLSLGLASLGVDKSQHLEELVAVAERRVRYAKADGGDRMASTDRDVAVNTEELTLTAPEPLVSEAPMAAAVDVPSDPPAGSPDILAAETNDMDEPAPLWLESATGRDETRPRAAVLAFPAAPEAVSAELLAELMSIDRALAMLQAGQIERIEPYLSVLVPRVLPLLDYYNRVNGAGWDAAIAAMRARVAAG